MAVPLQLGFTDYEQIYAKKKTRRQRFLEEMEITIPWEAFLALIEPVYHKPSSKGGRPPGPPKSVSTGCWRGLTALASVGGNGSPPCPKSQAQQLIGMIPTT